MYIAHKKDNDVQLLKDHLINTAELASNFAKSFNAEKDAYLVGLYHDIGKYSEEFQKKINGENIKVDHSTPAAKEIFECTNNHIFAEVIAGHHTGLPDLGSEYDLETSKSLQGRFKRKSTDISKYKSEILNNLEKNSIKFDSYFSYMFYIRMLFSCLVDADYLDTEQFMCGNIRDLQTLSLEQLTNKINEITESIINSSNNELNKLRSSILKRCITSSKELSSGFYKLSLPTGAGKTLDSITFALNNAVKNHKDRVIFIVPYTSIIDQTAEIYKEYFGDTNILEHHSGIIYEDDNEVSSTKRLITQNWDSNIIVSTVVQFFESLFSYKTSQCRKLHNIANSIIIFDEVQTLPVEYLKPCLMAMYELYKNYNCSIILSTATQPPFEALFKELNIDIEIKELCQINDDERQVFEHCNIEYLQPMTKNSLINLINKNSQSLIVCNTKALAQEIYSLLPINNKYYLTTNLTPYDRKQRIQTIRNDLKNGKPVTVVSTSLIEAGVDFDFQFVYREMAGIDSIIQCAGRCNREGKKNINECKTYYFEIIDNPITFYINKNVNATKYATKYNSNLFQAQEKYYKYLWKNLVQTDKNSILEMHKGYENILLPFREISNKFELIESDPKIVYVDTKESHNLINKLKILIENDLYLDKNLLNKLSQFSIGISIQKYDELVKLQHIELLDEYVAILNEQYYNKEIGLFI